MDNVRAWLVAYLKTFKLEDANVVFVTGFVTAIGKICSGFIPIIALVIAMYQLKIQSVRLKTERLKQVQARDEVKEG